MAEDIIKILKAFDSFDFGGRLILTVMEMSTGFFHKAAPQGVMIFKFSLRSYSVMSKIQSHKVEA